ncbi:MAG: class I SAM-dependent methyltransferase [Polynucleobacter sp.]
MHKRENTEFAEDWLKNDIIQSLSPYSREFALIEYGRGIGKYAERLKNIGLNNDKLVLDAGGGIGNWAIPLALMNENVEVVDILSERLLLGKAMADRMQINNIKFRHSSIEKLPYSNSSFDSVICYSVIMFTDINKTLNEFNRVLKPGGKLFLMTDLWRWYLGKGYPEKDKTKYIFGLFKSKIRNSIPKFLSVKDINNFVIKAGFEIIDSGQDGHTSFKTQTNKSGYEFYPSNIKGKEELWEICALKK